MSFQKLIDLQLIFSITGKKYLYYFIGVIILIISVSFVDVAAIGTIYPLLDNLTNSNHNSSSKFLNLIQKNFNSNSNFFFEIGIIVILLLSILKFLLNLSLSYFGQKFSLSVHNKISLYLFKKYLNKDYIFFLNVSSASLIRNIITEITFFTTGILTSFINLITETILLSFFITLALLINFKIAMIVFTLVLILAFLIFIFTQPKIRKSGKRRFELTERKINDVTQALENIKQLKILNAEEIFTRSYDYHNSRANKQELIFYFFKSLPKNFIEFIILISIVCFLYISKSEKIDLSSHLPLLGTFALISFRMIPSFSRITVAFQQFSYFKKSASIIYDELKKEINKNDTKNIENIADQIDFQNQITLEDINYKYKNSKFELLIPNLIIKKNSYIGLKGASGSGKSTLVNLILGLIEPQSGKIKIDNSELNQSSKKNWYKKIGFLPQEVTLINDTILYNITFGTNEKNKNFGLINKLFQELSLENLVDRLKDPIFKVGEKGTSLSGGEKQRLGLVRALYRNPELLILDEPTSSIDKYSSDKIMNFIHSLKNTTKIIISHNNSDLEHCDDVFELDKGLIKSKF